jgi:hypothetical protein
MERHQRLPKKALRPRAELARFLEELESEPGDYERLAPEAWPPLEVLLPKGPKARRTLFVTKRCIPLRWMDEDPDLGDWAILCRPGLPTASYRQEISAHCSKTRPAIFLGDLDPLDIHVYLTLREEAPVLRYGGLNDACLDLCERNLKQGRLLLGAPLLPMGPMEQRHFSILDSMVDLAALIGPRSRDLLQSGRKLELEGATNMSYFKRGHLEALRRLLERTKPTAAPAPARPGGPG